MKKVLATGASGFIGRNTIKPLLERGFEVFAVTNSDKKFAEDVDSQKLKIIRANLLDSTEIKKLFEQVKPDYLLHLAWDTTPCKYWTSDLNFEWTQSSIEIIKQFNNNGGKRAVMAGTCAEYDWNYDFFKEYTTPENPKTPYGICKNSLRKIVDSYCDLKNISLAWGRIFFVYGPNENKERLIPYVINNLLNNQSAECTSGEQARDFLHVTDVANAFVSILASEVCGSINICSGEPVKINSILKLISAKLDKDSLLKLGAKELNKNEPETIVGDNSRLLNEVGWKQIYNIKYGIESTIDWWERN